MLPNNLSITQTLPKRFVLKKDKKVLFKLWKSTNLASQEGKPARKYSRVWNSVSSEEAIKLIDFEKDVKAQAIADNQTDNNSNLEEVQS